MFANGVNKGRRQQEGYVSLSRVNFPQRVMAGIHTITSILFQTRSKVVDRSIEQPGQISVSEQKSATNVASRDFREEYQFSLLVNC
jgi:hypothetical protein